MSFFDRIYILFIEHQEQISNTLIVRVAELGSTKSENKADWVFCVVNPKSYCGHGTVFRTADFSTSYSEKTAFLLYHFPLNLKSKDLIV